ncbi:MAG: hypothetical protein KJP19_00975, partial [Deltaproteobacteria bacterium]|nr:hypothetical protein [Deltaproteobacteria bacterium]
MYRFQFFRDYMVVLFCNNLKNLQRSLVKLFFLPTSVALIHFSALNGLASVNTPLEITLAQFKQVPCLTEERYSYYKGIIYSLSYPKMRALRAFCSLPDLKAAEAIDVLEKLVFFPLSFDQARFLEMFLSLSDVTIDDGWKFLELTSSLEFTAIQAMGEFGQTDNLTPEDVYAMLNSISLLEDSGRWAVKALFSIQNLSAAEARAGIEIISTMSQKQHGAAEQVCVLVRSSPNRLVEILQVVSTLNDTNATNIAALYIDESLTLGNALDWLKDYFSHSEASQETIYFTFSKPRKTTLLNSFSDASDYLIWKINNLHSVTNEFGSEIGTGTLVQSSSETLRELFEKLHPGAQRRYSKQFQQAIDTDRKYDAAAALKQATALARTLTARDLTSANIYILLSRGSELYDSSFRDILVPVLIKRIQQSFNANLLEFLINTDPENGFVSDFIVSCAQKGKLTAFFPTDPLEQRKILDLVTGSAFQNEQSLILFSATFTTLLQKLQPEVRTYLLKEIIKTIKLPNSTFALQLRVILQYYLEKYPGLLSASDKEMLLEFFSLYGTVDLSPLVVTDFSRWKQDGRLNSLSIFQHDDDGRSSYLSNSRNLIDHGYKPRLSNTLNLLPQNSLVAKQARELLEKEKEKPGSAIGSLYTLSVRTPLIVEWHKDLNDIELSHAVAVYQDRITQRQLLKLYIENNLEMFAQRGHSYWRKEQLLEPMQHLLDTGEITQHDIGSLNRFMSIGSCGGIRVYTELNKLFDNTIDILATVGTGKAVVNDPYNQMLFEIIATTEDTIGWEEIAQKSQSIFAEERGSDYLLPGSLPAI